MFLEYMHHLHKFIMLSFYLLGGIYNGQDNV